MTIEAKDLDQETQYLVQAPVKMFNGVTKMMVCCNFCMVKLQEIFPYPIYPIPITVISKTRCPICKYYMISFDYETYIEENVYAVNISDKDTTRGAYMHHTLLCIPCILIERENHRDRIYIVVDRLLGSAVCINHNNRQKHNNKRK